MVSQCTLPVSGLPHSGTAGALLWYYCCTLFPFPPCHPPFAVHMTSQNNITWSCTSADPKSGRLHPNRPPPHPTDLTGLEAPAAFWGGSSGTWLLPPARRCALAAAAQITVCRVARNGRATLAEGRTSAQAKCPGHPPSLGTAAEAITPLAQRCSVQNPRWDQWTPPPPPTTSDPPDPDRVPDCRLVATNNSCGTYATAGLYAVAHPQ